MEECELVFRSLVDGSEYVRRERCDPEAVVRAAWFGGPGVGLFDQVGRIGDAWHPLEFRLVRRVAAADVRGGAL